MTDIKLVLHIYHVQYLYLTLLFWLSDPWPWHGDLYLDSACYFKIAWTEHLINAKTVHLLHFANISDVFEGQWPWLIFDPFVKVTKVIMPWTLLVSAILPQQNIISMPKWYIWWVFPISRMCSDLWPTFQGQISQRDLSCLSIQFLLAYIRDWHQTITLCLPCPVLVPCTIILALWPLTLAWWPLPGFCLLPQNCLNETSHQCQNGTFAAFCQYLRWVRWAVTLVELYPTFQRHIGHCKTCYNNTICIKHHIHSIKGNIWWILQLSCIRFKESEPGWHLTYFSRSDMLQ